MVSQQLELFDIARDKNPKLHIIDCKDLKKEASFLLRAIALFLDFLVVGTFLSILWALFKPYYLSYANIWLDPNKLISAQSIFLNLSGGIFLVYYYTFFTYYFGCTLGKYVTNIRVISNNGQRITLKQSLKRHIWYFSIYLLAFSVFFSIFKRDRKSIHDSFAKTIVVYK